MLGEKRGGTLPKKERPSAKASVMLDSGQTDMSVHQDAVMHVLYGDYMKHCTSWDNIVF